MSVFQQIVAEAALPQSSNPPPARGMGDARWMIR